VQVRIIISASCEINSSNKQNGVTVNMSQWSQGSGPPHAILHQGCCVSLSCLVRVSG